MAYALGALALGFTLPRFEHRYLESWVASMSAPAAMALGSSVASGMISLTGIVFSLTFVMVQFSATAYSPRLVVWLSRDPVMTHALGVFSATFLYALFLVAWVDRGDTGRVPFVSTWLVVLLLLASVGMFIALIGRTERLQVSRMLVFTADQGRRAIEDLYASGSRPDPVDPAPPCLRQPPVQIVTHVGRPQAIQAVDPDALVRLATGHDAVIELAAAIGDTLVEMTPLFRVYGSRGPIDEQALLGALDLGDERTFEQDPKYAIRLVVDIAIKALSPAINDPTTAVQALDQIEDLLLRIGRHRLEQGEWSDREGRLRFRARFPTWDDFLLLALDEIRYCGSSSIQVMRRMMALIKNLQAVLPPERHPGLRHWNDRVRGSISRAFDDAEEKRDAAVADRQGLGVGQAQVSPSAPAPARSPSAGVPAEASPVRPPSPSPSPS